MSRAPSDSLDENSWEGNLANLIFQAISVIPGHLLAGGGGGGGEGGGGEGGGGGGGGGEGG